MLISKAISGIANAIMLCLLFWNVKDDENGMFNRFSCLFMLVQVAVLGNAMAIPAIFLKKVCCHRLHHDRSRGRRAPNRAG